MNGYIKELKIIPRETNTFDLWIVEDGEDTIHIGKIEFDEPLISRYCVCLLSYMKDFNY